MENSVWWAVGWILTLIVWANQQDKVDEEFRHKDAPTTVGLVLLLFGFWPLMLARILYNMFKTN